jgi:rRNA-processing protein FCF1
MNTVKFHDPIIEQCVRDELNITDTSYKITNRIVKKLPRLHFLFCKRNLEDLVYFRILKNFTFWARLYRIFHR